MVARALAQEPRILLLDEPMRSLDLKHTRDILRILSRIGKDTDLTVLLVSHDLNTAARFAERVVLLKDGCVLRDAPVLAALEPEGLREVFDIDLEVLTASDGLPVVVPSRG